MEEEALCSQKSYLYQASFWKFRKTKTHIKTSDRKVRTEVDPNTKLL